MSSAAQAANVVGNISGRNVNQQNGNIHGNVTNNFNSDCQEDRELRKQEDLRKECMRALLWTDPEDDLARTKDRTGGHTPGTCEWILENKDFKAWQDAPAPQTLLLTGEPGIGKTVMATFLIDRYTAESGGVTFVYFLCSATDTRRSTGLSVLRGVLFSLLRQHQPLQDHVIRSYNIKGRALFESLETLWPMFEAVVTDGILDDILLLVDGLDEYEEASRELLVARLTNLMRRYASLKLKVITCSRVIRTVDRLADCFAEASHRVIMDTGRINLDLQLFVESKVKEVAQLGRWSSDLTADVEEYVNSRVGGTFVWVSLALKVASSKQPYQVMQELALLPQDLQQLYVRIFAEIDDKEMARRVLNLVIAAAKDPMSLDELALALLFYPQAESRDCLPSDREIDLVRAWPKSCAILLRIPDDNDSSAKVNVIHLTVQEFLESPD